MSKDFFKEKVIHVQGFFLRKVDPYLRIFLENVTHLSGTSSGIIRRGQTKLSFCYFMDAENLFFHCLYESYCDHSALCESI